MSREDSSLDRTPRPTHQGHLGLLSLRGGGPVMSGPRIRWEANQAMASIETKNMEQPDESRTPEKTSVNVVHLGDATVARLTAQPGWKWSDCIKPLVGTDSCQAAHLGYVVSGKIHITSTDGTEADLSAGDAYRLEPGHDAWVVGDEPLVALEFESKTAETYARG
jgi:hypothetical protein